MPKRSELQRIMVIGSGPIVIGQACEFDYSGTQAVKALREEGCEVILVNSNPATIMTDPGLADRTYIEPIEPDTVAAILRRERPDALLPTLGGQTGLNTALFLAKNGVLKECGTELIGANAEVIEKAESRELFRAAMESIGLAVPRSGIAHCLEDVRRIAAELSFPLIVRPAFTLGGSGGGVAYNQEDLEAIAADGLAASLCQEVLVEQSVMGWKEIEMEVMRDRKDNCVVICSIENLDPMGVHTGDSVTVAPVQTLSDREYQRIRDASIAVMRAIGVETGGSNVQFGLNPENGELVVIEMNPRVSRSSALASKATGFPIAKIAAKLALGYTLDELPNDITRETMASFEPALDYCVVKIPRFTFEKFQGVKDELTTSMKSVGETMAIGRTFKEALQKGLRSLEIGVPGLGFGFRSKLPGRDALEAGLRMPNSRRLFTIRHALLAGMSVGEIHALSAIDPWFIGQIADITALEEQLRDFALANPMEADNPELRELFFKAKEYGFSDRQLAEMWKRPESDIAALGEAMDLRPVYRLVDTCAAEFEAYTPYFYSTYETLDEREVHARRKVVILGGGPNRIGQGIEFDYCCCQASFALRDEGVEAIMVNSNPETVSTDYDTSDRLYFEPLTFEDVMHIVRTEKPDGVIVQFGGQTPLNLAVPLQRAGITILGTSPDAIDRAEDRERFQAFIRKLNLRQPQNGACSSLAEAEWAASRIGWPVIVRPSYVLGGRAMQICYDTADLEDYFRNIVGTKAPEHPILIDQFLENAIEVDVDVLADGREVYVAGVMEHIEAAGIHSGDSACSLPAYSLPGDIVTEIERQSVALARELRVVGLMNIQFAVRDGQVYILEVNPRASRTVPFVSKATGVPLPRLATLVMLGKTLEKLDPWSLRREGHVCVKEAVFPFNRFPGVDILLGPEMRSTGEVMGIAPTFDEAFLKSQLGAGQKVPDAGKVFISVNDRDKECIVSVARSYAELGFTLLATRGTAGLLGKAGLAVRLVPRLDEGRPNIVDMMKNGEIAMIVNTTEGGRTTADSRIIRQTALRYGIPFTTTIAGAKAMARAIHHQQGMPLRVACLQDYYEGGKA